MMRIISTIIAICVITPTLWAAPPQESAPPPASSGDKFPVPGGDNAATGSLGIKAVQGTPGGPAILGQRVEIDLFHRGTLFEQMTATLDEHGVVVLEGLPIDMGIQPVVRVLYGGVAYQQQGEVMDLTRPQQMLEVVCYELSPEAPPWRVAMRHVMIEHAPEGARVTEVVVIENPAEVTWVGVPDAVSGRSLTVPFALTEAAKDVQLGAGFHGWCCTAMESGRLQSNMPLVPGRSEYSFSYLVPGRSGTAQLDITATAPTDHMMVIVPEDISITEPDSLVLGGTDMIAETQIRYYTASAWKPGQTARVELTGLSSLAAPAEAEPAASSAKVIAIIGGALIVFVGAAILFRRAPKQPQAATEGP